MLHCAHPLWWSSCALVCARQSTVFSALLPLVSICHHVIFKKKVLHSAQVQHIQERWRCSPRFSLTPAAARVHAHSLRALRHNKNWLISHNLWAGEGASPQSLTVSEYVLIVSSITTCVTFNYSSAKPVSLVFRANPFVLSSVPGQLSNLLDDQEAVGKKSRCLMTNLAYLMFGQQEPRFGLGLYFLIHLQSSGRHWHVKVSIQALDWAVLLSFSFPRLALCWTLVYLVKHPSQKSICGCWIASGVLCRFVMFNQHCGQASSPTRLEFGP